MNKLKVVNSGFSIIEMLVVLVVFSILAIVTTQTLSTSLRGSRKSDAQSRARQNVDFAMSTMERLLRNTQSITSCSATQLNYMDEYNRPGSFRCACSGTDCYIASGSATPKRITSPEVVITCSGIFSCPPTPAPGVPPSILITITGRDATTTGAEGNEVTSKSRILLRTYDY